MQNLVIVESPTKARMLEKYLGSKYKVEASMGHLKDLPKSEMAIDVEHNFEPKYIVPKDKVKRANELKKLSTEAQTLWLATDPDREGEAIAWHISDLLGSVKRTAKEGKLEIKRVTFHEITPQAIKEAFETPRQIDQKLVDAQQARRVLDRLVGYKLSPLLWKKVKSGLSAGRVQTVALRLIVEREREVLAFKPVEYWSIEAMLSTTGPAAPVSSRPSSSETDLRARRDETSSASPVDRNNQFLATLVELDGKKLEIKNSEEAKKHVEVLEKLAFKVGKVTKKEVRRFPYPPFTTSTLQQTASLKLGLSAKKTMMVAQNLYEQGLITYMRTDSVNLAPVAIDATRNYIGSEIGKDYLPSSPRVYKTKSKLAQEAHEAIRPTDVELKSDDLKTFDGVTRDHIHLYELIWKRMVASQMAEAVMDQTSVDITAGAYTLRASGSVIKFDGWLKIMGQAGEEEEKTEQKLPELKEQEDLNLEKITPLQHFTEPLPRFNEASLIKKLEELGIGRPSTYAPTLSTIQDRFYVEKRERRFFPTELGNTVTDFLIKYFPNIFDYDFTATMEDEFDDIAEGKRVWQPTIGEFYKPFEKRIEEVQEEADKVKVEAEVTDQICPKCGKNLVVKFGRFGKFLACSGFPDCKHTEGFEQKVDAICPKDGGEIVLRRTKKGRPFYGCKNWPKCDFASWTKPKKP